MQKITIEVNDTYIYNVIEILQGLKGVMIDTIQLNQTLPEEKSALDLIRLQTKSMKEAWENSEDEVWNDL